MANDMIDHMREKGLNSVEYTLLPDGRAFCYELSGNIHVTSMVDKTGRHVTTVRELDMETGISRMCDVEKGEERHYTSDTVSKIKDLPAYVQAQIARDGTIQQAEFFGMIDSVIMRHADERLHYIFVKGVKVLEYNPDASTPVNFSEYGFENVALQLSQLWFIAPFLHQLIKKG